MAVKSITVLAQQQTQLETTLEKKLQENQKLLADLEMMRGIVERKRYDFLNKSDRDKFMAQTLKSGV